MPEIGEWVETAPGARRRVLSDAPGLMMVEFQFEAGAVGALHNHPHIQGTYVASGRFEFTIGSETTVIGPGDSMIIPTMVTHGCVALEAGSLIDSFTPRRDDFL
ncbi:cupin domain-containing protein [Jannaschia sp. 2305UL9-9]|uniref:cupin domain-containing protein n=1 Tax=Jannaschia sp. 2305UL9-9 TaxID=3121638 RepID=UPI003528A783